jgi:hypothetical protein
MDAASGDQLTPSQCDAVAAAVIAQFNILPRNGKPTAGEWTVLAGIAAVRGTPDLPLIHVLSCCTGTKCIGRSRLQGCGSLLHDSHAEVIARRNMLLAALQEFARIVSEGPGASPSGLVFEWPLGAERPRVIAETKFCLYVSQSPCGDASIYDVSDDVQQLLPSKRLRVQERLSSADAGGCDDQGSGSGSFPASKPSVLQLTGAKLSVANPLNPAVDSAPSPRQEVGFMRTKPGRGPPTHCMSCSDKILRWCCEGLQGAAASCLFQLPLACIIIGDQFNADACFRAFTLRCISLAAAPLQVAATKQVFPFSRYQVERTAAASADSDLSSAAAVNVASAAASADSDLSSAAAVNVASAAAARAAPLSVHWRAGAGRGSEVSIANGIRHGTTLGARAGSNDSSCALVSVCKRLMLLYTSRAVAAAAHAGILAPKFLDLWGFPPATEPPPSNWVPTITWSQAKGGSSGCKWRDRLEKLGGVWVGAPKGVDEFCLGTGILSMPLQAVANVVIEEKPSKHD